MLPCRLATIRLRIEMAGLSVRRGWHIRAGQQSVFDIKLSARATVAGPERRTKDETDPLPPGLLGGPESRAVRGAVLPSRPRPAPPASRRPARSARSSPRSIRPRPALTALTEALRPRARSDEIVVASRGGRAARARRGAGAARLPHARRHAAHLRRRRVAVPGGGDLLRSRAASRSTGQVAVAEVVLNRVADRRFPSTVCGVTKQGAGSGRGCQFSYACDGNSDVMKSALPALARREARHADARRPGAQRHRRRDLLPHPLGPPRAGRTA